MIEIWIPGKPPTATSQQKGRTSTGVWYKPAKLKQAEAYYMRGLRFNIPDAPLEGPVILSVDFRFPATKPHKPGEPKITRPDTDNMIKLLKDCMTRSSYWIDDAQVAEEIIKKTYAEEPGVKILVSAWGRR